MNLSQLEVFVAIVDAGNLSDAAEVVSLTQSAVSYSLSRLEAELGVTLLERGRQGITLTRIGEEVVQHARNILAQIEVIRQKAAHEQGLNSGKLRFGCVPTIPARLLTGILRSFQLKYPDIEIVVFEGTPFELVEWLGSGVIDIGTVISPQGFLLSAPFVHAEVKALLPQNHALATSAEIPFKSLVNEALIGPEAEYRILNQLMSQKNLTLPRIRYAVSTQSTILAMVRENMGVALMLDILIDPRPESVAIHPLVPRVFVDIYLATTIKSPAVDVFMANASNWAKEHNFWTDKT